MTSIGTRSTPKTSPTSGARAPMGPASLKLKSGPPLRPWKCWPLSVKSTVRTIPAGPLGVSAGERQTLSTRLSGSRLV
jgi:hypothetical protein